MSLNVNTFNVVEDGYLQLGENIANVTFHPTLNVLITTTRNNKIKVFDPHTAAELADVSQTEFIGRHKESTGNLQCSYLPKTGAVIFCGRRFISLRQDQQGVLLLKSLLQTKVSNSNEIVTIELLMSEAWQLQKAFKEIKLEILSCEGKEVVDALDKALSAPNGKSSHSKEAKWRTICLKLSLRTFSYACTGITCEYKRLGRMDPGLSLASALTDRLSHLMEHHYLETSEAVDREHMYSESTRLATFYKWPHMNYKWALPEQMAQAGFFHQPATETDDRAMCFICNVCLVYWEPKDEPWSEHERHSPNCPFVRGELTHNVPLSVTCAAYPALKHTDNDEQAFMGSGNSAKLTASFTESAIVAIWNTSKQLKKEVSFTIDPSETVIFNKHFSSCSGFSDIPLSADLKESWAECEDLPTLELDQADVNAQHLLAIYKDSVDIMVPLRPNQDLKVTSISVVCEPEHAVKSNKNLKTSLIVGSAIGRYVLPNLLKESMESINSSFSSEIQELNIVNLSSNEQPMDQDALDIMLLKENEKDTQTYPNEASAGAEKFEVVCSTEGSSFIPYLIVYDLNELAKEPYQERPSSSVVSHGKGSSKKAISLFSQTEPVINSHHVIKYSAKPSAIQEDKLPITVSDTKKVAPICIQCVKLPQKCYNIGSSFLVNNILPTPCGNYVLVSISNTKNPRAKSPHGYIFLFKIDYSGSNVKLFELPVCTKECDNWGDVPERIIFVPTMMEDNSIHSVVAACVTADRNFIVLPLSTLETAYMHYSSESIYNDLVYCNSIERICVTGLFGRTNLFHIINKDSYEEQEPLSFKVLSALCDPSVNLEANINCKDVEVQPNELLVNQEVNEENLDKCLQLTHFTPVAPRFVSPVSPCWVEMMQAQKQRRNPQHLHQKEGDCDPTRTWRLRGDATTKGEHLLDLLFSPFGGTGTGGGLQIGHIDVKINFDNDQNVALPQIQVTLLKQNLNNPNKQSRYMEETGASAQTCFLDKYADDILCGPVIVNNYIDLSGLVATVALTSPALMACRSRSYLVHLQALKNQSTTDKSHPSELRLVDQYIPVNQNSTIRPGAAGDSRGCNVINDLSIKVYTCKKTSLPHDRLQRLALLEKEAYHELLLKTVVDMSSSMHSCSCSMDLFLWILTVHLNSKVRKVENIIKILEQKLPALIKSCIIFGDRSIARKALKIILVAFDNLNEKDVRVAFGAAVLHALLQYSDAILECRSAGALSHYFSLLNHVKWCDLEKTSTKISTLLSSVASSVSQLNNPLQYLLQTKFNLHGLPFERQMFDTVPTTLNKQAYKKPVQPIPTYHPNAAYIQESGLKGSQWKQTAGIVSHISNITFPHQAPPPVTWNKYVYQNDFDSDLPASKAKIVRREQPDPECSSPPQQTTGLCGLLEVEPLHFSFHSASEGMKIEKVMPGSSYTGNPLFMYPIQGENYFPEEMAYHIVQENKKYISAQNGQQSQSEESLSGTPENNFSGVEVHTAEMELLEGLLEDQDTMNEIIADSPIDVAMFMLNSDQEKAEVKNDNLKGRSSPPYMLSLPPQHVLVFDRMHSGARRFVVLDFGYPVVLTDVIIPACRDLVSLTLDIWLTSEEQDGERLAVACDIGVKPIVLCDLQPPPLCRYLKITTLGRYGLTSTVIRIPVGEFYGHSFIFPWNLQRINPNVNFITKQEALNQITVLRSMTEDLGFRYSLSCSKLKSLLNPLLLKASLNSEFSCTSNACSSSAIDNKSFVDLDTEKCIRQAYQECIIEQQHLNLVIAVLERLEHFVESDSPSGTRIVRKRQDISLDQLSTVLQYLINCLLEMAYQPPDFKIPKNLIAWCNQSVASSLINEVCLQGPRQSQFNTTAALISRLCVSQPWWGEFLGEVAVSLFKTGTDHQFSTIRIYSLLCLLGQRSCESGKGSEIINSIVDSTLGLLSGIENNLDMPLIWWVLLFLSGCLDIALCSNSPQKSATQNRWSWIGAEKLLQEKTHHPCKSAPQQIGAREKLRKRLSYHRQKLVSLETATKSFGEVLAGLGSWGSNPRVVRESQVAFSRLQRQHALKHFKDLCSIRRHETNNLGRGHRLPAKPEDSSRESSQLEGSRCVYFTPIVRTRALEACRRLVRLLVSSNPVEIDSFMLTCKVIGELARSAKPSLHLGDILTQTSLEALLCQTLFVDSVSGGQWATHSLSCLLQDILEGELLYGSETTAEDEVILEKTLEEEAGQANAHATLYGATASGGESSKRAGSSEADGANQLAVLNSPPLVNLAMSRSATAQEDDVMGILSDNFRKLVSCDTDTSSDDGFEEQNWEILNSASVNTAEMEPPYTNCITISLGAGGNTTKQKMYPLKGVKTNNKADQTEHQEQAVEADIDHSSTLNCRSESGLLLNVELRMIMMNAIHSTKVAKALSEPVQSMPVNLPPVSYKSGDMSETVDLLSRVFQNALSRISIQSDYKRLESLLEMWINLNMEAVTEQVGMSGPIIPLHKTGISAILLIVSRWGTVTVRGWYLILQTLSMCCTHDNLSETNYGNQPETFDDNNLNYLAWIIATDRNFLPVLVKLFSANCSSSCGSSESRTKSDMVGSTVSSILENFLMRLVFRCNMMPCPDNQIKENPKVLLLKLLLRLLEPGAAFCDGTGAMDAQKTLLDVLLTFSYDDIQSNYLILSIINSVAPIVHNYISCSESKVFDGIDGNNSTLFASVLGSESKQAPPITRQVLMCSLVNLCTKMLLIPIHQSSSPLRVPQPQPVASSSQTDELKALRNPSANATSTIDGLACSHSSNDVSYLVDEVLKNNHTMQLLIQSLGKVQGSSFMVALGSISRDISEKFCLGETFTDALYRLLLFINMKTTNLDSLLMSIIQFLTPGDAWSQPCLSELLYCYLSQVLDCPRVLEQFSELGGFKLLWTNLVKSVKWAGSGQISSGESGIVSAVLNQLNPALPAITTNFCPNKKPENEDGYGGPYFYPPPKPKVEVNDVNRFKGLYNFAPLAVISSSNRSARPADCLIQTMPHYQRTKAATGTPPWSYHFYPYENWVDLILTLPCAIMLHEVHLCPHSYSTIMSPSAVSIETGVDVSCLTPATGQIMTAGMSSMMIVLPDPVVAAIVIIRLTRPLDQSTLGLSRIKLLGTTALKTIPRQLLLRENGIVPPKTSVWWLRMIHHCLYEVEGGKEYGIKAALKVENAMKTLVNLLCQAEGEYNWQENHVDTPLEKIAFLLAEANQQLRSEILEGLLNHPVITMPTAVSQDTAITLLYQMCIDDNSADSIRLLLAWLDKMMTEKLYSARRSLKQPDKSHLNPLLIQCIATVIWKCKLDISYIISENLLKKTYDYYKLMSNDASERVSQILCSMCMVNPSLFLKLLALMGILTVKETSSRDDNETDQGPTLQNYCTDDMKESMDGPPGEGRYHLQDKADISIDSPLLHTLSIVAQSPQAANILLESGFPILLVKGILEWCKSELISYGERESSTDQEKTDRCQDQGADSAAAFDPEMVVSSLEAFVLLVQQAPIKEWLGSREGSVFWIPLLNVLGDPIVRDSEAPLHSSRFCNANLYVRIEDATISLMKECALYHRQNQKHLASALCQLIQRQKSHSAGGITFLHYLSGFTRRLVLQMLLEKEFVAVNVSTSEGNFKSSTATTTSPFLPQPRDGIGHRNQFLYLPVSTTIDQLITTVTDHWQSKQIISGGATAADLVGYEPHGQKRELGNVGLELVDKLSLAAGGAAKVKRMKNLKNKFQSKLPKQKTPTTSEQMSSNQTARLSGRFCLCNEYILRGRNAVPSQMTLAQVLSNVHAVDSTATRINFSLVRKNKFQDSVTSELRLRTELELLLKSASVPSLLESFTNYGVLSILAERMSLLYPDNSHQLSDQMNSNNNEIMSGTAVATASSGNVLIPPHSLGAFTLFLRLPGYPEAMLTDSKNACSLLRIALGATISAPEERRGYTLATLPFKVLEGLLASIPLTTDDGQLLRRTCLKVGAVHLILACLAALSHQDSPEIIAALHHPNVPIALLIATARTSCTNQVSDSSSQSKVEGDRRFYWAKGTGFGTGSTNQYWNVEHSLHKQQMEEQHIVWMLRLLSQYINPVFVSSNTASPERSDDSSDFKDSEENSDLNDTETGIEDGIPGEVFTLFKCSGLISKISSYLTNDSVLDMSRHVPLYRALMDLIKGIALSPMLMLLLLNGSNGSSQNDLPALLARMLITVNTYMSKLTHRGGRATRERHSTKAGSTRTETADDSEGEEGLALLVPHIRTAAWLVKKSMTKLKPEFYMSNKDDEPQASSLTDFESYSAVLKPLQFDVYEMIVEGSDGKIVFTVPYTYENLARNTSGQIACPQKRLKRLAQEVVTLSSSLPLSLSSSVFVRTDVDRLDVMKVLITGPEDTPYANGCFEFDVFFPPDYPSSPLLIKLQTTGERKVRFNPNLYKDGKICLSILNTWNGRPEEKWNPNTSSLLQVLVSIQSLILVSEPYFNEPGYERSRGTPGGIAKSNEYDATIRLATVRWAILNQLRNPSSCFKEVVQRHFYLKKNQVMETIDSWINEMETMKGSGTTFKTFAQHLKKLRTLVMAELSWLKSQEEEGATALAEEGEKKCVSENQAAEDALDLSFANIDMVDPLSFGENGYLGKAFNVPPLLPELPSSESPPSYKFDMESGEYVGGHSNMSYVVQGVMGSNNMENYADENIPDDGMQSEDTSSEVYETTTITPWQSDPKKEL